MERAATAETKGKAQPVDDFEQLQKVTLKERYDVIKRGARARLFLCLF